MRIKNAILALAVAVTAMPLLAGGQSAPAKGAGTVHVSKAPT